jgi:transcriptional regulator with XRE-family HTH domain
MDVDKTVIGEHIRVLRLQQNRTIAEIARECQFSKSLLSKIENGKIVPSVGALVKIASALGTSVAALIESNDETQTVFTPRETSHKAMIRTEKGLYLYPFATEHKNNRMQPFLHSLRRDEMKPRVDSHQGQEFIFVLKGVLKFRVGRVEYILKEGDSIYFNSIEKHEGTPMSDLVEYLDIFT